MVEKKLPRSAEVKRQCIDPNHKHPSVARQCQLVGLARSSWYYEPRGYADGWQAEKSLGRYFDFYRDERPHQALGYRTPSEVYAKG